MPRPASTGVICAARSAGRWCPWSPRNSTLSAGASRRPSESGCAAGRPRSQTMVQSQVRDKKRQCEHSCHGRGSQRLRGESKSEPESRTTWQRDHGDVERPEPRRVWFNVRAPTLDHCRAVGLRRPDGDAELADRQRLAEVALGVRAEEPDVEVGLARRGTPGWAISRVLELFRVRLSTTSE